MFGFVGLVLYKLLQKRAQYLGYENSELSIKSNEKILEVLNSYREAVVRNRRGYYAREIGAARLDLANNTAEISFMPNISKYVIEATVVLGTLIICASQFLSQDSTRAVATLSIFLAAGTRIAPAVLRLQQGAIQIRSGLGSATPTLDLIERLGNSPDLMSDVDRLDLDHVGFDATLELRDITFTYPLKEAPAVSHVDLALQSGKSLAFVGPSGAGKTTIVDLLLGVLKPDQGAVTISGLDPLSSISKWAGAISYVPQDVMIANGTIRENVALGYPKQFATDELVWEALDIAQLNEFVRALPLGLETHVGERGAKISGGQRQRLGIARAMFTRPKLLVLDEATSSLDGKTESDIADSIHKLKGSVTVVMIAHRLSTVQDADYVAYMEDGRVISVGSFNEVRANVPNFDQQAAIMGLN
jgi:ABC-type multidrug transport system fused ATPase/permease subunit